MAPKQRKGASSKSKDKDEKADDKKADGKKGDAPGKEPSFMDKHVLKVQIGLMCVAFLVSVIPRIINGHDKYRFEDSYKDPIAWHKHFAKDYSSLFSSWGYNLHSNASKRLHSLLGAKASSATVLDVGAGSGLVGIELKRLGFKHITGLDVVPEILAEANATGAYEHVVSADIESLPSSLSASGFDAVLCIGTAGYLARGERDTTGPALDHSRAASGPVAEVSRVDKLFEEWLRVLKPGGILGLTAEVLLKAPWEDAFAKLQQAGSLKQLEVKGPMSFVPLNGDKLVAGEQVHMYFYEKTQ